jgi:Fe-S-cluster containining protein
VLGCRSVCAYYSPMEFTLDIDLIRRTLKQELKAARSDLRAHGPLPALARAVVRHDAAVTAAHDVGSLACRSGCDWCCHFTIDVRAAEVFAIHDFVESRFSEEARSRVYAEVESNSRLFASLSEDARALQNVKCPFLVDHQCSIYAVRPQSCRNYHATNSVGCEQSYRDPDNQDIDPEFAPGVYQVGVSHVEAFSVALREAGYDVQVYELNGALEAARTLPEARALFEARRQPFADLPGDEVDLEFDDLLP